jgi:acyl-coenzyme A thioesterase PaaI-like protein
MACAVHTTLEAGYSYATVEVKINFVRPITVDTGEVRAEGKVINSGKRIATAEGRLFDSAGKLYAHGTTTCLIFALYLTPRIQLAKALIDYLQLARGTDWQRIEP